MAANYWESTQRRNWQFTKDQLVQMRQKIEEDDQSLVQMFPLPQLRHLYIFFNQQINRLGKRLSIRQQAMATAQVYIKRFYTRVEIRRTHPYLVIATAVYLACKMEECPQHIRMLTQEARHLWPDFHNLDTSKVGECEFFLISEMNSQMIIHQPYRTLTSLQSDLALSTDDVALAWSVVNDHYMTDLPLLYPPHIIAVTAILFALTLRTSNAPAGSPGGSNGNGGNSSAAAAVAAATAVSGGSQGNMSIAAAAAIGQAQARIAIQQQAGGDKPPEVRFSKVGRFVSWLSETNIDVEAIVDCTQELISFYECHEQYNDKNTREQINRFVKARGLDK